MNSLDIAMTCLYLRSFVLALLAAAAPGIYDGDRSNPKTNPLEGLFGSMVVASMRISLLLKLMTKSMGLFAL